MATISAPIWKALMTGASAGMPIRNFARADDKITNGDRISVPSVSGMSVEQASAMLKSAGFTAQVAGRTNSGLRQGLVVYTDPSGTAIRGSDHRALHLHRLRPPGAQAEGDQETRPQAQRADEAARQEIGVTKAPTERWGPSSSRCAAWRIRAAGQPSRQGGPHRRGHPATVGTTGDHAAGRPS